MHGNHEEHGFQTITGQLLCEEERKWLYSINICEFIKLERRYSCELEEFKWDKRENLMALTRRASMACARLTSRSDASFSYEIIRSYFDSTHHMRKSFRNDSFCMTLSEEKYRPTDQNVCSFYPLFRVFKEEPSSRLKNIEYDDRNRIVYCLCFDNIYIRLMRKR